MEIYVRESVFGKDYRRLNGMAVTQEVRIGMEVVDFDSGKRLRVLSGAYAPGEENQGVLHISDHEVVDADRVE